MGPKHWLATRHFISASPGQAALAAGLGAGDGGPGDLRSSLALWNLARARPNSCAGILSRAFRYPPGGAWARPQFRHVAGAGRRGLSTHGAYMWRGAGPHSNNYP